ncbi:MAG: TonB-dependent receptor [Gammaproteobacteria bacterium]|nr:TonB-dependent receptor [Gammaproteobacteria bacterium]
MVGMTACAGASGLEEIVVTAQKREQNINDVGVAVTAFSGEQMNALGIESSTDLIAFTPGVSLAGDIGGQRAIFNIRGVVQNDYADIAEAPVAVYVDDSYLASTQAQTFGLFDIERIEVLKGPQGTLFGRNATGGLVNTITAKPTYEFEGYGEFTAARFDQYRFEGAVSGALSDNLRARVAFLSNLQGEILKNVYVDGSAPDTRPGSPGGGQDTYNDDTQAVRAHIEYDLNENGSLLLSANWADTTKSEGPYQAVNTTEILNADGAVIDVIYAADDPLGCDQIQSGRCVDAVLDAGTSPYRPVPGGDFSGNIDPDGSGRRIDRDFAFDDQNQIESHGITGTLDYDFGGIEFVSISDYKKFNRIIGLDPDVSASPEVIFQSDGEIEQFSQELRISGLNDSMNWVAGLYYLGIDTEFTQGLAGSAESVVIGPSLEFNTITSMKTDSYSIFGQVDYSLTSSLVGVAGIRYIREEKSLSGDIAMYRNLDDRVLETHTRIAELESANMVNNQDLWSAKIQLEYTPDDDSLYYIGLNRGVKAGSFSAPLLGGFDTYKPEILLAYEAGVKLTLADSRVQLNASAFYYDYTDYQSFSWVNNVSSVRNEDAEFTGVELELFITPTGALDIMFGGSWTDAQVKGLEVATGLTRDTRPAFTPEYQASGLVRYNLDTVMGTVAAQLSGTFRSEVFHNARNFTAHEIESHTVIDVRLTWSDPGYAWTVTGFIDNLLDSDHGIIGFDNSGFTGNTQISYARPRTYGVTIRRDF